MDQKGHFEKISSRRLQSHVQVQLLQEFCYPQHEGHNIIDRFKETENTDSCNDKKPVTQNEKIIPV